MNSYTPLTPEEFTHQRHLYRQYIAHHEGELYWFINTLRTRIDQSYLPYIQDAIWEYRSESLPTYSHRDIRVYPHGFCTEICQSVEKILTSHPIITEFVSQGGIFGHDYRVFQEDGREKGFANIIRMGHKILDPAYEELSNSDKSISIEYDSGEKYAHISYQKFVQTARIYWGDTVHCSAALIGTNLARYFPFVQISPDGDIVDFPIIHPHLITTAIESQGESLKSYLRQNSNQLDRLTAQMIAHFRESIQSYIRDSEGDYACSDQAKELIPYGKQILESKNTDHNTLAKDPWKYPESISCLPRKDALQIISNLHDYIIMPLYRLSRANTIKTRK